MRWTAKQREIFSVKGLCDVTYSNMWASQHALGYSYKGFRHYGVKIAKDLPKEVRAAVLIHEVSHAYLGHLDKVDQKKELEDIKKIFDELNIPFSKIASYGGPMSFLNICMDLEINTSILTVKNVQDLCKVAKICTPDIYGIPVLNTFRDYYRPLIERLRNLKEDNNQKESPMPSSGKDLSDRVDPMISNDIDQEIKDELRKEGYTSGNEREQGKDPSLAEDKYTLEEASEYEEAEGDDIIGKGRKEYSLEKDTPDKLIQRFLSTIIRHDLQYFPDHFKHYNRNTRRSDSGILYTSRSRKVNRGVQRLAILIDVSGSMEPTQVLKAINTFKNSTSLIAGGSKLVTWDTDKIAEYPINEVPSKVELGGGTDIGRGLKYLSDQGFEDIVIYSDFETSYRPLISAAQETKANIYSICTDIRNKESLKEYFFLNKKVLQL